MENFNFQASLVIYPAAEMLNCAVLPAARDEFVTRDSVLQIRRFMAWAGIRRLPRRLCRHAHYLADAWLAGLQQHARAVCCNEVEAIEFLRDRYRC